jgi:GNAT superfamily N-acetyltransferase
LKYSTLRFADSKEKRGDNKMTFYQELQLSSAGSKQLIKNTTDKKEKWRHILIYNFKVYLVMAFCVAVVTLYTKLTGQENSVAGVTVLLALLVLRQADFGIRTSHGLLSIVGIFTIMMAGPRLANMAIYKPLKLKGAIFEPEQMKMIQGGFVSNVSTSNIETLSDKWMKQYYDLHNTDTYWTAKRIVSALDKFRVFLAVKDEQVLGYLDVQSCYDINEIYALYVKPEVVSQGYELALLANAIELNRPNQMMVVVDVDNREEVDLYTAAGFVKLEGHNSMTAYIPQLNSGLYQSNFSEYIAQFCRHSASQ